MIQCTEYYNRAFAFVFGALSRICWVSDLHWGLALSLLKVAFGHFFLISLWIWPCVLVGAYDVGFWVELYDPVCKSF